MGVFDSIKNLFGGEGRTFEYVCQNCELTFESDEPKLAAVECPECHSTQVRSARMVEG